MEPEKPPLRCYYDYSGLISLSDNYAVMAYCDCAIADWSVCLIVLVETLRHEMKTFTYLHVQKMWANKCPLPSNLIENRSSRIGRSKNQSARDLNNREMWFSISRSKIFSNSLSSFSLRNLFDSWCLKYRWILSSSFLHNFATICILISKCMRKNFLRENRIIIYSYILL